ncbi:class I SAM-dependent methyltransferase [Dermacoccus nishinomiyaensis]|uniref:class I SAM-dependent methyltransferase n=1 Tax=Dermacoccus nishinomiyaensis TaxID=1274 RepID=UPI00068BE8BE|nr:class I SAM-dependent methyltransferase [Dermacoccus nishinomiyaensis]
MTDEWAETLREQRTYYDERAGEYDDFWFRRRAYALEEPLLSYWRADADATMRFVSDHARGDVLELACGTGIFTDVLCRTATSVHAVDASPAMLERSRARVAGAENVSHEQADLFDWRPTRTYDVVFFSFWLSHVPDDLFTGFWAMVRDTLTPEGVAVFVDSMPHQRDAAPVDGAADAAVRTEQRTLNDGRQFRIVKRYWDPATLTEALRATGYDADVEASEHRLMLRGISRPAGQEPR